jgi:plasmid maintenance system killer protein
VLSHAQFIHSGLEDLYYTGTSTAIPATQWPRCDYLLQQIDAAVKPDDLKLPGHGFRHSGSVYSVVVAGANRIAYEWRAGRAADIDYV